MGSRPRSPSLRAAMLQPTTLLMPPVEVDPGREDDPAKDRHSPLEHVSWRLEQGGPPRYRQSRSGQPGRSRVQRRALLRGSLPPTMATSARMIPTMLNASIYRTNSHHRACFGDVPANVVEAVYRVCQVGLHDRHRHAIRSRNCFILRPHLAAALLSRRAPSRPSAPIPVSTQPGPCH